MMKPGDAWGVGFLITVIFVATGELSISFHSYVFERLGINRDIFLIVLWVLPFFAAFVCSYFAEKFKLSLGLSFVLLLPVMGAFAHWLNGEIGGTVDFVGYRGAVEIFLIYFVVSIFLSTAGTLLGILLSTRKLSNAKQKR